MGVNLRSSFSSRFFQIPRIPDSHGADTGVLHAPETYTAIKCGERRLETEIEDPWPVATIGNR
jgi:hypothetical protein